MIWTICAFRVLNPQTIHIFNFSITAKWILTKLSIIFNWPSLKFTLRSEGENKIGACIDDIYPYTCNTYLVVFNSFFFKLECVHVIEANGKGSKGLTVFYKSLLLHNTSSVYDS